MNNKYIYHTLSLLGLGLTSLTSCTDDFANINTNQLLPKAEILVRDAATNSVFLPGLQMSPIQTGTEGTDFVNSYQVTNNLTADSWIGYLAPTDAKWSGRNLTQFYFDEGWTNGIFSSGISAIFKNWLKIKELNYDGEAKNLGIWYIAQMSKIMGLHRTADRYGAIPYFKVGGGAFKVPYDSQEDVYKSFFQELEEAINYLYPYSIANPVIPKASDLVYEGRVLPWVKFGNSLMLRLAMRVRYVDPALSQLWAEKAMAHPAGLIETVADNAFISDKSDLKTKHALFTIAGSYNDTRMGASIYTYLKGYNDPRLARYFTGNTNVAIPPALPSTGGELYSEAAKPLIAEFSPTVWMKASEISFLLAEAALVGYNTSRGKTTKEYYEQGIRLSFEENQITEGLDTYLNGTSGPASFTDSKQPQYSAVAPATVTVKWVEEDNEERKLEKIIVQKYLAIFPDGVEAWSEWRRTGYPRLLPPHTNISNASVITSDGYKDGVRCIPYPQKEFNENRQNVQDAVNKYRGGANVANVNVWWDAKVKN